MNRETAERLASLLGDLTNEWYGAEEVECMSLWHFLDTLHDSGLGIKVVSLVEKEIF